MQFLGDHWTIVISLYFIMKGTVRFNTVSHYWEEISATKDAFLDRNRDALVGHVACPLLKCEKLQCFVRNAMTPAGRNNRRQRGSCFRPRYTIRPSSEWRWSRRSVKLTSTCVFFAYQVNVSNVCLPQISCQYTGNGTSNRSTKGLNLWAICFYHRYWSFFTWCGNNELIV